MVGLALSFVTIMRLITSRVFIAVQAGCFSFCPTMDGGASDSGPITQNFAYISGLPAMARPVEVMVSGPQSQLVLISFLLGVSSSGTLAAQGLNACPWNNNVCAVLTQLRLVAKQQLSSGAA